MIVHLLQIATHRGEFKLLVGGKSCKNLIEPAERFLQRNLQLFEAGRMLRGVDFPCVQRFQARSGIVTIPIENPDSVRIFPPVHVLPYFPKLVHAELLHHLGFVDRILLVFEARLKLRGRVLFRSDSRRQGRPKDERRR
ncbi:MAG: hypothetical protein WA434_14560 [Candidatus Acidiferrales bacterium]